MVAQTRTVRQLDKIHHGVAICIICGKPLPTNTITVRPDQPPKPQFPAYIAPVHVKCFTALPVVDPSNVWKETTD